MAEIINSYETVFVLSLNLGEEGIASTIEKFKKLISDNGTLESVDEWGKRRLAYPIMKQPDGYYTLINFKSEPDFTSELNRIFNITEGVLRSLTVSKIESSKAEEKKAAPAVAAQPVAEEAAPATEAEAPAAEE